MHTRLFAAALGPLIAASAALADPAMIVAPGGAGGGYDAMARLPFEAMEKDGIFTDGVTVANQAGGGGIAALANFVNAERGNDNALMSTGAIMIGTIVATNAPVSMIDVTPLARLAGDVGVVAVASDSPVNSIADLTAAMQQDPASVTFGGGATGGLDHIVAALTARAAGMDPRDLAYTAQDSGADTARALADGTISAAVSGLSEFRAAADAGEMKLLAVTSAERVPGVDVPTLKEAGIDAVLVNWRGLVGAPGMSDAGRALWLDRLQKMHDGPAWQTILTEQGWQDEYLAGEDFVLFLADEARRQEAALKAIGLLD